MRADVEDITSARQLQLILDLRQEPGSNPAQGLETFGKFLRSLNNLKEVTDRASLRRWDILQDYLKSQLPPSDDYEESVYLKSILQAWSYASQNNSDALLSSIPTILAILLSTISTKIDYRDYGLRLCRTLLQQSHLKLLGRGLSAAKNKPQLIAPCLQLLNEVVSFDGGALAKRVYASRELTFKGLARNMALRSPSSMKPSVGGTISSIRELAVRYLLANFNFQNTANKRDILAHRDIISAIFRDIKEDGSELISKILTSLRDHVVMDEKLEARSKNRLLSDWNLGRIAMLYGYANGSDAVSDHNRPINVQAHDFLLLVCTTPGLGVLYPQSGWYPSARDADAQAFTAAPDGEDSDSIDVTEDSLDISTMFHEGVPVRNSTLAAFTQTLRPYASVAQSELLLQIFKAAPELVAEYFFRRRNFSFEPKLTTTWTGYAALILSTIKQPVPTYLGRQESYDKQPPPICIVIENILPQPLSQKVLTRCLNQNSHLVTFFAVRLLIVAFEKLEEVLAAFEASVTLGHELYKKASSRLVSEFCRRCPKMKDIISTLKGTPESNVLLRESAARLLRLYYKATPQVALDEKFDVSVLLASLLGLSTPTEMSLQDQRLRSLELEHLVHIARSSPNMRWWHRPETLQLSPFATLLKLLIEAPSGFPVTAVKELLCSVAQESQLLQAQTRHSSFDALLGSLQKPSVSDSSRAVFDFLDNIMGRYVRKSVFYQAEIEQLGSPNEVGTIWMVSPLLLTMVEQWPFVLKSTDIVDGKKVGIALWMSRFLGYSAQVGEDEQMLAKLVASLCRHTSSEEILGAFKGALKHRKKAGFSLSTLAPSHDTAKKFREDATRPTPRQIVETAGDLDVEMPDAEDPNALFTWVRKEIQDVLEDGDAGRLVMCLCSDEVGVRIQALSGILKLVAKTQASTYPERETMELLLQEVAHTAKTEIDSTRFPTVLGVFAAQAISIQANPQHFLYGKLNHFLHQGPKWELDRVPLMHQILLNPPEDDDAHYAEVGWLLDVLVRGLQTPEDLDVYRQRTVFERVLTLYSSSHLPTDHKKQIIGLIERATAVKSGAMTLVSRTGLLSWLHGQLGRDESVDDEILRNLVTRLWTRCDQDRVVAWSGGREKEQMTEFVI